MLAPDQWWIIRFPSDKGAVVAKLDTAGETQIPDSVAEYDGFVIQSVPDESELTDKSVDHSDLSDEEREILSQVYPVEF
jgi:hypothetical protein